MDKLIPRCAKRKSLDPKPSKTPRHTHTHAPFTRLFSDAIVQLYDGYVAPMDDTLLGLSEVAPGIADSFASSTSTANTFLIVFGLFGLGR